MQRQCCGEIAHRDGQGHPARARGVTFGTCLAAGRSCSARVVCGRDCRSRFPRSQPVMSCQSCEQRPALAASPLSAAALAASASMSSTWRLKMSNWIALSRPRDRIGQAMRAWHVEARRARELVGRLGDLQPAILGEQDRHRARCRLRVRPSACAQRFVRQAARARTSDSAAIRSSAAERREAGPSGSASGSSAAARPANARSG